MEGDSGLGGWETCSSNGRAPTGPKDPPGDSGLSAPLSSHSSTYPSAPTLLDVNQVQILFIMRNSIIGMKWGIRLLSRARLVLC